MSNIADTTAESTINTLLRKEPHWLLRWGTALMILLLLIIAGIAMLQPWKVSRDAIVVHDYGTVIWVSVSAAENTSISNGARVIFTSGGNLKQWHGTVQTISNKDGRILLKISILSPAKPPGEKITGKGKIVIHQTLISRLY